MSKEIGGYMELEHFSSGELYEDFLRFNLGRTAFVWLLQNIEHDRVFVPEYICSSVPDSAIRAGYTVVPYELDESLCPVWKSQEPGNHDILYLVNYYGQLTEETILNYHAEYPNLIVDNAQAFYDQPLRMHGIHTIYTARKYFGVSDGAYIATDLQANYLSLQTDMSGKRIRHLTGRLEGYARDHYSEMLAVSDTFTDEIPKKMSLLTRNILSGIHYDSVRRRRINNYKVLSSLLPDDNPFVKNIPSCPFAYPFHHPDGISLRKFLAAKNIFVPTNWSYLLKKLPEGSLQHDWSANILPLPVDQRYDDEDMKVIAETVRSF